MNNCFGCPCSCNMMRSGFCPNMCGPFGRMSCGDMCCDNCGMENRRDLMRERICEPECDFSEEDSRDMRNRRGRNCCDG